MTASCSKAGINQSLSTEIVTYCNLSDTLTAIRLKSIWGPNSFLDWAKGNYYASKIEEDVPRSKALIPGYEEILKTVCGFYSIDEDDLYKAKQGVTNEPQNVSIY